MQMDWTRLVLLLLCATGGLFAGSLLMNGASTAIQSTFIANSSSVPIIAATVLTASSLYTASDKFPNHKAKEKKTIVNVLNDTTKNSNKVDSLSSTQENEESLDTSQLMTQNSDSQLEILPPISPKNETNLKESEPNLKDEFKDTVTKETALAENLKKETKSEKKPELTNHYPSFELAPIRNKITILDTFASIHSDFANDVWQIRKPRKSDLTYGQKEYFVLYPSSENQFHLDGLSQFLNSYNEQIFKFSQKQNSWNIVKVVQRTQNNQFVVEYHIFKLNKKSYLTSYFRLFSPKIFQSLKEAESAKEFEMSK